MSNFTNRKRLSEEELVNNSEDNEFSDDHSQSYGGDMSSENTNGPISS